MGFNYLIMQWYRENKRDLPWRHTNDPYLIWVSEVILQQTRVEQGLAYYHRFVDRFPDIASLARAEEEEVMKIWQGLGYYSRARNMHFSARILYKENQSKFPASYDEIIRMRGIGDYSASAISSIVYSEAHPVVDGNVLRVMARYEGITEPVNTAASRKKVKEILKEYIDKAEPGIFNQALMELGALICKPKQPLCAKCPIMKECYAYRNGRLKELPVINKSKPVKTRFFHYLVVTGGRGEENYTWLNKRTGNDIWKNLYDFPLIEHGTELSLEELQRHEKWQTFFTGSNFDILPDISVDHHILSHQELRVIFVQVVADLGDSSSFIKSPISDIHKYPVPRLIENIIKKVTSRPGIFSIFPD